MYSTIPINDQSSRSSSARISVRTVTIVVIGLPILGFLFSVIWSLLFEFDATTNTHCRVDNYLPSISAAFNYSPASFVWRICIALHCAPRLMFVFGYYYYNRSRKMNQTGRLSTYQGTLARFTALMTTIENLSLVLLTMVSSNENKSIHVVGFSSFLITSVISMITTLLIHNSMTIETTIQRKSLKMKRRCCSLNILSLVLAMYFYYRHNAYCERGVYTLFALCEYIVVLSNMGFHWTVAYDFDDSSFKMEENGIEDKYS